VEAKGLWVSVCVGGAPVFPLPLPWGASCGLVNLSELCIASGQCVWMLQLDVVCLCHDGNVVDAALIALVAALRSLRLPVPTVLEDGEVVVHPTSTTALTLGPLPVSLTCGVVLGHVLSDPTALEEAQADASVTVVLAGAKVQPARACVCVRASVCVCVCV
jgi:exosome complex RNA-binding protein Rrp42 (RNase PH superfamily)